jgi:ribosomal-protein-alanine N-acetyltransferase
MARVAPSSAIVARRMVPDDVPRVASIEAEAFSSPWKADTFTTLLQRPGAELWVLADPQAGVVAYAVVWCILDQGELANIAVASSHRGRGLGRRLLELALDAARQRGVKSIYLEVRSTNVRAANLYQAFGFERIGVRRDYYDNPTEDAILMVARL